MGKLIKYELKKQGASRMVIFIALAAALLAFWVGFLFEKETVLAISILAMVFGGMLAFFYTGIESILVLNRDLRTRQSYMLWMLPKSIWEILGAKFISAILQMLIVFGTAGIAVGVSMAAAIWKIEGLDRLIQAGQELSRIFIRGGVHWGDFVLLAFVIFLAWTLVIMTGFLSVILSRTVLIRSKFAGLFAVILFFVITFVIERLYEWMYRIPGVMEMTSGHLEWNVPDTLYYIAVCAILFGVSGMLAERKLSV